MIANYNSTADENEFVSCRKKEGDGENAIKDSSLCCLTNFVKSRATPRRATKLPRGDMPPVRFPGAVRDASSRGKDLSPLRTLKRIPLVTTVTITT